MSAADELRRLISNNTNEYETVTLLRYMGRHAADFAALIEAAEATINNCDKPSCATCGKLQAALKPFEVKK